MEVKHTEGHSQGKFNLIKDANQIGVMSYVIKEKNIMDIQHTLIDEDQRGNDYGMKLVEAGVNHARRHQLKILPSCPYVKKILKGNDKYSDVLN